MPGLAAFHERAPGGFVFLVEFEPAVLLRIVPFIHGDLQQWSGLADGGIEADEFLGFLRGQPDQNALTSRIDLVAVFVVGHDAS